MAQKAGSAGGEYGVQSRRNLIFIALYIYLRAARKEGY